MLEAHIQLEKIDAKYAILPGDPKRIDLIKTFLDDPKELMYNREFRSVEGTYKGIKVIAMSTGMGSSSISIAVEELAHLGVHTMIRVGSAGALQSDINLGDLILGEGAIRDDGASKHYAPAIYPACPNHEVLEAIIKACKDNDFPYHTGVIQSHETFYYDNNSKEEEMWSKLGVLGGDFESAALFTVGRIRKVRCASILNNVVLYGEDASEAVSDYVGGESLTSIGEKREIKAALDAFYLLENK
ncbi:MAG: nucleoside phosphorylase [Erysipelotrichaceae bacterium]|nr:nucleoside phosphorylase [Erysipelotrichaceae bacterium]